MWGSKAAQDCYKVEELRKMKTGLVMAFVPCMYEEDVRE